MCAHAGNLHSRDCLQDMARPVGERSQLAGRGTYHSAFCPDGFANAHISKGEIDIVEGVNDQGSDLVSLHTSPGTHFRSRARRAFSRLRDAAQIVPCRNHVL
jgi:hypothetical protein